MQFTFENGILVSPIKGNSKAVFFLDYVAEEGTWT